MFQTIAEQMPQTPPEWKDEAGGGGGVPFR